MVCGTVKGGDRMKTPKTNRDEVRSSQFTVLSTAEEKANIDKAAHEMGVSRSTFVRMVMKEYLRKKEREE